MRVKFEYASFEFSYILHLYRTFVLTQYTSHIKTNGSRQTGGRRVVHATRLPPTHNHPQGVGAGCARKMLYTEINLPTKVHPLKFKEAAQKSC